ncbi:MAG: RdgB/HAM1 family non-canonical purine NTP pyrophosphatase [Defluviitaleaceae bacterium]|nr:RdgB/HAM1 family non-canonical purine NTP pyrophosphatase [Defluviitaleaceae bacterium]
MDMKIIFATKNQSKIREIREIMEEEGLNINLVSMEEAGYTFDTPETGATFEENAVIKARAVCVASGCIALADDSGFEVDFLNKNPGVDSANYMGRETPYLVRNNHILDLMKNVPTDSRTARFVCVIAAALPPNGEEVLLTRATIEGLVADKVFGENGFGYDPIFYFPEKGKTTAEMTMEEKNAVSHRGKALRLMCKKLMEVLRTNHESKLK